MNWRKTEIDEIKDFGFRQALHLKDFTISIKPGQLIYLFQPDIGDKIIPLTCIKKIDNQYWYAGDKPIDWKIGKEFFVRGPIGNGFHPIDREGKILFIIPGEVIGSLQPLMDDAIQSHKSVAIFSKNIEWQIHPEAEIVSLEDLDYAINWADYIYLECMRNDLYKFVDIINRLKKDHIASEIFIYSPVLCGGTADCMVCSVQTKSGYRRICKEGPIILVEELEFN